MNRLLTAEFRKITTLRLWWALGLAPLLIGLLSGAISVPFVSALAQETESDELAIAVAAIGLFVALGSVFLFAALFGALNAGAEYRHNTFAGTFLTTRGRDRVVAAKLLATAAVGLLYCLVVEVVSVPLLLAFAPDDFRVDSTIVGVLLIGLVASTLWTLLGAGLALATASSIGSAVGIVAWYVAGEGTVRLVLSRLGLGTVAQWLPGSVTLTAFAAVVDDSITPGWPQCLVALALWAVASCGLGWWATRRRDIA
ncbi:ABC transporter permease [Rhodococcus hoagii]|nr:ABC transporter permease [Prescottella equi]NKZ92041.1 ABC transporter permease [Prescottella equi]